ncbi:MAG: ubiquinone/menaquinone biosynthesis methyltransferase UbiE, partial [Pseudomonadota bacterium]
MAQTHFGYQTIYEAEKASRVRGVFDSVAAKYDVMNDVLSFGLHRAWKAYTVAVADVRPGMQVLDIAGGTGDLARAFAGRAGPTGCVVLTDINQAMLTVGRDRLLDEGLALPTMVCDAEHLPFPNGTAGAGFDRVSVAFGLRMKPRNIRPSESVIKQKVHDLLRTGFDRSPMFQGRIEGVGPRYCPSIEDKINRFAERDRHQLFVEPEGWNTVEIYVNGFSTSLPEEVQYEALRSVPGFENCRFFRPGYA